MGKIGLYHLLSVCLWVLCQPPGPSVTSASITTKGDHRALRLHLSNRQTNNNNNIDDDNVDDTTRRTRDKKGHVTDVTYYDENGFEVTSNYADSDSSFYDANHDDNNNDVTPTPFKDHVSSAGSEAPHHVTDTSLEDVVDVQGQHFETGPGVLNDHPDVIPLHNPQRGPDDGDDSSDYYVTRDQHDLDPGSQGHSTHGQPDDILTQIFGANPELVSSHYDHLLSSSPYDPVVSSGLWPVEQTVVIDCPKKCVCNKPDVVDCSGQNLTAVPKGISPMTQVLDLSMNNLKKLPEKTFEHLPRLIELRCVGNNLTKLHKNLFKNNRWLNTLNFQGNRFTKVPPRAFQNLEYLLDLYLDTNVITMVPRNAFAGLIRLKHLRLDANQLDHVPVQALRHLPGLWALAMSDNKIKTIPDYAFENNTNLIQLILTHNKISEVGDQAFYGLSKMNYLHMDKNRLTTMPASLSHLVSLVDLNLEDNLLSHLPDKSLQFKEKLESLLLRNNPITSIGDKVFTNLPKLEGIDIPELYDLTKFPDLTGTHNLKKLHLDRASIRSIPPTLCSDLPHLEKFDVHSNKIGSLPDMSQCKKLSILNLANNELTSLESGLFDGMDKLQDLSMNHNYIQSIEEGAFRGLGELEYLNLAENQIVEIHSKAFVPLKNLKDLNLGGNHISHLPTDGLQKLESLKVFDNPELTEFPPPEAFPKVTSFVLSYTYHCCDFINSRPETSGAVRYPDELSETFEDMPNSQYSDKPNLQGQFQNYSENFYATLASVGANASDHLEMWLFGEGDKNNSSTDMDVWAEMFDESYVNVPGYTDDGNANFTYVVARPAIKCKPKPGPFMPCDDLFGWWSLRCGVWFVFLLALLGNGVVFFVSVTSKSKMDVPRFLICNLAVADFFMGIYLGFLAIMDASTLGQFKKYAIQWQLSAGCLVAGTLGVLSSELSVYTLTVITLERFYAITHAMQLNKRLSLKHAGIIMACGWLWSFGLAVLPLFGISDYRKFAVCLPFEIEDVISKSYVCFIMVFNGISFFIIMSCYLIMYISIRDSQAWNSNDTRVAKRMALLVFTDFLCWAPVAFLSLAAAFGKNLIHLNEAKVLTIFVLPLNSCANPFLYAFFTKQFKKDCVLLCRRLEDSSIARHFSQVSQRHASISWKGQRRPSALHSLMGEGKSQNSNNQSVGSNSYGLVNYNSEISTKSDAGKDGGHGCDKYKQINNNPPKSGKTCNGFSQNGGRHSYKYKPCPGGVVFQSEADMTEGVARSRHESTNGRKDKEGSNMDDAHVILHQDFYSQSCTETNGNTSETFVQEDSDDQRLTSDHSNTRQCKCMRASTKVREEKRKEDEEECVWRKRDPDGACSSPRGQSSHARESLDRNGGQGRGSFENSSLQRKECFNDDMQTDEFSSNIDKRTAAALMSRQKSLERDWPGPSTYELPRVRRHQSMENASNPRSAPLQTNPDRPMDFHSSSSHFRQEADQGQGHNNGGGISRDINHTTGSSHKHNSWRHGLQCCSANSSPGEVREDNIYNFDIKSQQQAPNKKSSKTPAIEYIMYMPDTETNSSKKNKKKVKNSNLNHQPVLPSSTDDTKPQFAVQAKRNPCNSPAVYHEECKAHVNEAIFSDGRDIDALSVTKENPDMITVSPETVLVTTPPSDQLKPSPNSPNSPNQSPNSPNQSPNLQNQTSNPQNPNPNSPIQNTNLQHQSPNLQNQTSKPQNPNPNSPIQKPKQHNPNHNKSRPKKDVTARTDKETNISNKDKEGKSLELKPAKKSSRSSHGHGLLKKQAMIDKSIQLRYFQQSLSSHSNFVCKSNSLVELTQSQIDDSHAAEIGGGKRRSLTPRQEGYMLFHGEAGKCLLQSFHRQYYSSHYRDYGPYPGLAQDSEDYESDLQFPPLMNLEKYLERSTPNYMEGSQNEQCQTEIEAPPSPLRKVAPPRDLQENEDSWLVLGDSDEDKNRDSLSSAKYSAGKESGFHSQGY